MNLAELLKGASPDDLAALKALLDGLGNNFGRSPIRPRQLTDLRLMPTKDDPRPTFFFSAEAPRNDPEAYKVHPYPRLMWHGESGTEITVYSEKEQKDKEAARYVLTPPASRVLTDKEKLQAELAALPAEVRDEIVKLHEDARKKRLQESLGDFSPEEVAAMVAGMEKPKGRPSARV